MNSSAVTVTDLFFPVFWFSLARKLKVHQKETKGRDAAVASGRADSIGFEERGIPGEAPDGMIGIPVVDGPLRDIQDICI